MSVEIAKRYFELMDSADAGTDDVLELYGDNPVVHSSRAGVIRGLDDIRQFYEDNSEFFTGGKHHMTSFHKTETRSSVRDTSMARRLSVVRRTVSHSVT